MALPVVFRTRALRAALTQYASRALNGVRKYSWGAIRITKNRFQVGATIYTFKVEKINCTSTRL